MITAVSNVLIIIVTWNKKSYVLQLLDSLNKIHYPADAIDIVVVDNASNDGTADAIQQQYPQVHLIKNQENIGGTGGFNTGMQWAFEQPEGKYDYLWLLDNDVMVHCNALSILVDTLDQNSDIGVAGSTMMQLDYPWRINEMGCFFDFNTGALIFNRHFVELPTLREQSPVTLAADKALKLTEKLKPCPAILDVDYVAAASLLIRAPLAKKTGLWKDFFIHFDDVEWCLRIGKAGHRVVVAADSIIWHLSAAAKIPTWVLYYDNRNILATLQAHGTNTAMLQRVIESILLKGVHYALLGKMDLSQLHKVAVDDFMAQRMGKKEIKLTTHYQPNEKISTLLADKALRRILVGNVNFEATGIQTALVQAMLSRPELKLVLLTPSGGGKHSHLLPRSHFEYLSHCRWKRWWFYLRRYNYYDAVIQSDYAPYPLLSLISPRIIFVNDESFAVNPRPSWKAQLTSIRWWLQARWKRYFYSTH